MKYSVSASRLRGAVTLLSPGSKRHSLTPSTGWPVAAQPWGQFSGQVCQSEHDNRGAEETSPGHLHFCRKHTPLHQTQSREDQSGSFIEEKETTPNNATRTHRVLSHRNWESDKKQVATTPPDTGEFKIQWLTGASWRDSEIPNHRATAF